MRKDSYKMTKSTKRIMALMPGTKTDRDSFKNIMMGAEMTYTIMKNRKVKEKDTTEQEPK